MDKVRAYGYDGFKWVDEWTGEGEMKVIDKLHEEKQKRREKEFMPYLVFYSLQPTLLVCNFRGGGPHFRPNKLQKCLVR